MDTSTSRTVVDLLGDAFSALQEAEEATERLIARIAALREHPEDPDGTYWAQEAAAEAGKALEKVGTELPPDGIHKKGDGQ
jgi:hypothetical protein